MKIAGIALCLLLLGTIAFGVSDAISQPTTVGILVAHQTLTANLPDWRKRTLKLQHQFGKRHLIGAELSETDRFSMQDSRPGISYLHPVNEKLTGAINAGSSPTHYIVAKNSLGAAL